MSPYRARPKGPAPSAGILIAALALGVVATGGALWLMGAVHFPWDHEQPTGELPVASPAPSPPAEGQVRLLFSPEDIPAYTKLERDLLMDPRGTHPRVFRDVPADQVPPGVLSFDQLKGRVLARTKRRGFVFTEADLLPPGTRPGLVAGIPPGKVAMRLEASQVSGLFGLHMGDRFDVVSTLAVEADTQKGLGGPDPRLLVAPWERKQARVRTIVSGGVVVQEVHERQKPVTSSGLTTGTRVRTVPVQEVVVAVGPDEVGALSEALAVGAEITCLVRSGRSDDEGPPATDRTPKLGPFGGPNQPGGPFSVVETINGSEREWQAVPSGPQGQPKDGD